MIKEIDQLVELEKKIKELEYFSANQAEMLIERNNKLIADLDFWRREAIASKAELGEIKIAQAIGNSCE